MNKWIVEKNLLQSKSHITQKNDYCSKKRQNLIVLCFCLVYLEHTETDLVFIFCWPWLQSKLSFHYALTNFFKKISSGKLILVKFLDFNLLITFVWKYK